MAISKSNASQIVKEQTASRHEVMNRRWISTIPNQLAYLKSRQNATIFTIEIDRVSAKNDIAVKSQICRISCERTLAQFGLYNRLEQQLLPATLMTRIGKNNRLVCLNCRNSTQFRTDHAAIWQVRQSRSLLLGSLLQIASQNVANTTSNQWQARTVAKNYQPVKNDIIFDLKSDTLPAFTLHNRNYFGKLITASNINLAMKSAETLIQWQSLKLGKQANLSTMSWLAKTWPILVINNIYDNLVNAKSVLQNSWKSQAQLVKYDLMNQCGVIQIYRQNNLNNYDIDLFSGQNSLISIATICKILSDKLLNTCDQVLNRRLAEKAAIFNLNILKTNSDRLLCYNDLFAKSMINRGYCCHSDDLLTQNSEYLNLATNDPDKQKAILSSFCENNVKTIRHFASHFDIELRDYVHDVASFAAKWSTNWTPNGQNRYNNDKRYGFYGRFWIGLGQHQDYQRDNFREVLAARLNYRKIIPWQYLSGVNCNIIPT